MQCVLPVTTGGSPDRPTGCVDASTRPQLQCDDLGIFTDRQIRHSSGVSDPGRHRPPDAGFRTHEGLLNKPLISASTRMGTSVLILRCASTAHEDEGDRAERRPCRACPVGSLPAGRRADVVPPCSPLSRSASPPVTAPGAHGDPTGRPPPARRWRTWTARGQGSPSPRHSPRRSASWHIRDRLIPRFHREPVTATQEGGLLPSVVNDGPKAVADKGKRL